MNITVFKDQIAKSDDESDLDRLCLEWIKDALKSNGKDGALGLELLKIIEKRCMP